MKKGDIIIGNNGSSYVLVKSIGVGGQAKVWKVQEEGTNKYYAYKHYRHDKKNVKGNIEDLIKMGAIEDKSGKALDSVIMPITLINGTGDSFGYIMELVDLKDYTTLKKAWGSSNKYPSCRAICRIIQNFAHFFDRLHSKHGMCYKDVNEGNIFFNPISGDIKIIDNDNIGYSSKQTIKGTPGYMAPEVILGDNPDVRSDQFSFAVFVYRLLVGGFPFEGPYTENYCNDHDVLPTDNDVRKIIFGKSPIFVWHPQDKRNSIENLNDPQSKGQSACWRRVPASVKTLFMNTFVTNLPKDRRANRSTDADWRMTFENLEKGIVKCPKCKAETFSENGDCFECGTKLNIAPPTNASKPSQAAMVTGKQTSKPTKISTAKNTKPIPQPPSNQSKSKPQGKKDSTKIKDKEEKEAAPEAETNA